MVRSFSSGLRQEQDVKGRQQAHEQRDIELMIDVLERGAGIGVECHLDHRSAIALHLPPEDGRS